MTERPERVGKLVLTNCDAFENFPPPAFKPMIAAAKTPGGLTALMAPMRSRAVRKTPMAFGTLSHGDIPNEVTEAWVGPMLDNASIRRDAGKTIRGMSPDVTLAAAERLQTFTSRPWWPGRGGQVVPDRHRPAAGDDVARGPVRRDRGARTFVSEDQPELLAGAIRELVREPVAAAAAA